MNTNKTFTNRSSKSKYSKILEAYMIPIDHDERFENEHYVSMESLVIDGKEYLYDNDYYERGVAWLKERYVDTDRIPRNKIIHYTKHGIIDALLPNDFYFKYEKSPSSGKWIKRKHALNPRKYAFLDGQLIKLGG